VGPPGEFWDNLPPAWRAVLSQIVGPTPSPESLTRLRRLTTDFTPMWSFEPMRALPGVTEALLWDENGMDLGPLTGRRWRTLHLSGPARVDLAQLRGTPIHALALVNVDVENPSALRDVPDLASLTLAYGDFGVLPALETLTDLVLHEQADVDVVERPGLRVRRAGHYWPPFEPADCLVR
jgi:hypothetical protein